MRDRSFFTCRGSDFACPDFVDKAIAELTSHHVGMFSLAETQLFAWMRELSALSPVASSHPDCTVAFEYMIPRMGRRVDAMVLIKDYIFVVEFKAGETTYPAAAVSQVMDYAFDLRNFHEGSHERALFPVIVCTDAPAELVRPRNVADGICCVQRANSSNLLEVIDGTMNCARLSGGPLDHKEWLVSAYKPTPTIIEAAQALYQHNTVEDISRNEAGLTNIMRTTECVNAIVDYSRAKGRKSICFVTGVPGAGKTLVGLNIASTRRSEGGRHGEDTAVFLSGNGPLITVLQASLVEDQQARNAAECEACRRMGRNRSCSTCSAKKTKRQIEAEVKSFVQGVHLFREELFTTDGPPPEHIAIFDEAQRAWTEQQLSYKMKTRRQNKREVHKSEPQCLIEYMDRHENWACIVCLVGGGQEIYQGEAGIIEWFKALKDHFPEWDVYAPDSIRGENYLGDADLKMLAPNTTQLDELHLAVDMRSFRNKNVAAFAEAVVSNEPERARALYASIEADYPIYVTRNLDDAKDWVRSMTKRPSDRYGIVADSYGQRIRADGILVPMDFDAVKWFLRGRDNIDSSYFMEIAASEFKIQGLEIDYAVVAWEGDYRYHDGEFCHHRFYGDKWQNVHDVMLQRYLKNGYRVLLTRARQGYVIYVPKGSKYDPTRPPHYYDETFEYLLESGIRPLQAESNSNEEHAPKSMERTPRRRKLESGNTSDNWLRQLRSVGLWFFVCEYETIRNWRGSSEELLDRLFEEGFDSKPTGTSTRISCTKALIESGMDEQALLYARDSKRLAKEHPEASEMALGLLAKYF